MRAHRPVIEPSINSIVLYVKTDNEVYPVYILKGAYESGGRLSNFWHWKKVNEDCTLGEEECGYGNFFECFDYKVITKHEIIKGAE